MHAMNALGKKGDKHIIEKKKRKGGKKKSFSLSLSTYAILLTPEECWSGAFR